MLAGCGRKRARKVTLFQTDPPSQDLRLANWPTTPEALGPMSHALGRTARKRHLRTPRCSLLRLRQAKLGRRTPAHPPSLRPCLHMSPDPPGSPRVNVVLVDLLSRCHSVSQFLWGISAPTTPIFEPRGRLSCMQQYRFRRNQTVRAHSSLFPTTEKQTSNTTNPTS
ncbi:hypothetical protein VTI74DRAFT_4906 [Chaetomium olivicolor]